jgi:hypothetical protein
VEAQKWVGFTFWSLESRKYKSKWMLAIYLSFFQAADENVPGNKEEPVERDSRKDRRATEEQRAAFMKTF